jgi:hypothetical protein
VYLSLVGRSHTAASQSVLLALLNIGMLIAYQTAFGVLVWRRLLTIWSSPSRAKAAPVDAAVVPVKTGAVGVDGAPQDSVAMTPMQQAQMKIGLPSHALKNPASVLPPLHPQHGVLQHTEPGVPNGTTDVLSIHPGADDGAGDGGGGAPFGVFSRLVSEPPREAPYHLVPAHKQTPSPTTPMSPAGGSDTALQHTQPNNPMQGSAAQLNVRSLQSPGVGDSASGFASQDPDVPFPAILPSRSVLDALSPTELSVWRAQVEHHAAEVDQLVSMQLEVQRADARLKYKTT